MSALLLVLLACDSPPDVPVSVEPVPGEPVPGEPVPGEPVPADPAPPEEPAAAPAPPARTAPAGPLWLRTDRAVLRLDGSGAVTIADLPGPVDAWTLGPDGTAWLAVERAVLRVEGDRAVAVAEAPAEALPIGIEDLAVDAGGGLWAVGALGVARYADGAWTVVPRDQLGPDPAGIEEVALGPDGTVWVRDRKALLRSADGVAWTREDLAATFPGVEFLDDLTLTSDGAVWLTAMGEGASGLLVHRDGAWQRDDRPLDDPTGADSVAVDADGGLAWMSEEDDALVRGAARLPLGEGRTVATSAEGIVVDARNRVWARTRQGLLRWDEDGTVQEYARGDDGLPAEEITALLVHAGGPDLGAATGVVAAVTGRLLLDGAARAGAPVALCEDYDLLYETHPCSADGARYEATTGPDGAFSFAEVPRGAYTFLARLGDEWTVVLGAHCCRDMRSGTPLGLGDVALTSDD